MTPILANPKSRRAIDEVLSDWRFERQHATTAARQLKVTVAGLRALLATIVLLVWGDLRSVMERDLILLAGAFLLGLTGVAWLNWQVHPVVLYAPVPADALAQIEAGSILEWVGSVAPAVFFLTVALAKGGAERRLPIVGMALVAAGSTIMIHGWGLPIARPAGATFMQDGAHGWRFAGLMSMAGFPLHALLRGDATVFVTIDQVNMLCAQTVTFAVSVVLGSFLRSVRPWSKIILAILVILGVRSVGFHGASDNLYVAWLRTWILPLVTILATVVVWTTTSRTDPHLSSHAYSSLPL